MTRRALVVARWEFLTTITRRAYIVALVATPLLYGAVLGARVFAARVTSQGATTQAIAVVDHARVLDLAFASEQARLTPSPAERTDAEAGASRPMELVAYGEEPRALADLRARRVGAVFVIDAGYRTTGAVTVYETDSGLFGVVVGERRRARIADALRASLMQGTVSGDTFVRAYAPMAHAKSIQMDAQGRLESARTGLAVAGPVVGSFTPFLLLTMAIFLSAGYLQQATNEERHSKMLEILVSSLSTDDLVVGKILGLSAAGLLQVAIYAGLLLVPTLNLFGLVGVPLLKLLLSLTYFAIGYLLFACLMAGTGMLGRTSQSSAQLSAIWTLIATGPTFVLPVLIAAPNGVVARVLSYIPLTGPVTMMLRLAVTDPPAVDIVATMGIGLAAIYVTLRSMIALSRATTLMYGQRPNLPQLMRWLRQA